MIFYSCLQNWNFGDVDNGHLLAQSLYGWCCITSINRDVYVTVIGVLVVEIYAMSWEHIRKEHTITVQAPILVARRKAADEMSTVGIHKQRFGYGTSDRTDPLQHDTWYAECDLHTLHEIMINAIKRSWHSEHTQDRSITLKLSADNSMSACQTTHEALRSLFNDWHWGARSLWQHSR